MALERSGHFVIAAEAYQRALAITSTHDKAEQNLARVSELTEVPGLLELDLAAVAKEYSQTLAAADPTVATAVADSNATNLEECTESAMSLFEQGEAEESPEPTDVAAALGNDTESIDR
jgi:hypothetical protein